MKKTLIKLTAELMAENIELRRAVKRLSTNASYNVLTRQGVERKWSTMKLRGKYLVLFDIDGLGKLNAQIGYQAANIKISTALDSVRQSELLGLVFSGDEFAVVCSGDEVLPTVKRLRESLKQQGLTATICYGRITCADFSEMYKALIMQICAAKTRGDRNIVIEV